MPEKHKWKLGRWSLGLYAAMILISPRRFSRTTAKHDFLTELLTNAQLSAARPEQQMSADDRQKYEDLAGKRGRAIRRSITRTFLQVGALILLGFASGRLAGKFPQSPDVVPVLRAVSVFLIAWGVLGRIDWEVRSIKGRSVAEQVHAWWFRALYCFGLYVGATSVFIR